MKKFLLFSMPIISFLVLIIIISLSTAPVLHDNALGHETIDSFEPETTSPVHSESITEPSENTTSQIKTPDTDAPSQNTEGTTSNTEAITDPPLPPITMRELCEHKNTQTNVLIVATCSSEGKEETVCSDCDEVIEEKTTKKIPHNFVSNTKSATCTENGEVYNLCMVCNYKQTTQTLQQLKHTQENIIISERTCTSDGEIQTICSVCKTILDVTKSKQYQHQWIEISSIFPTPVSYGSITYQCYHCEIEKTDTVEFSPKGETNLCIPKIKLNVEVTLAACNQRNTDTYDICCDVNFINNNNPVIFGHNTRSLGKIYKLEVGDIIYFTLNGETAAYIVTVSEEGTLYNGNTNIKGDTTGELVISNKEPYTLHFFTCYSNPFKPNSRWIVLAEKIEN